MSWRDFGPFLWLVVQLITTEAWLQSSSNSSINDKHNVWSWYDIYGIHIIILNKHFRYNWAARVTSWEGEMF